MNISIIVYGNYVTGWYDDLPHIIATCDSEEKLISYLMQIRELYEESIKEAHEDNIDLILQELKIDHAKI